MNVFSRDPLDKIPGGKEPGGLRGRLANLPRGAHWAALAAAVAFAVFLGWLGIQALSAKSNLEQARSSAQQAKDALLSGESEDATRFAESAQSHARQAQAATHSLPWNISAFIPILGSPLKATQQISDVVVSLADDVLIPGATLGAALTPDKLIEGSSINLKLLRDEEPRLSELSEAAAKIDAQAQAISDPAYLSVIGNARSQLQGQTSKLAQLLGNTAIAAKLAPSMLGADGPRTYLMGFQTNAEARGTGGLLGGIGVLRFENGVPTIEKLASNNELLPLNCPGCKNQEVTANIDLGPEFNKEYGWTNPYTDIRNSNLSPHFPYAAQIWRSMWQQVSGDTVDGVIAVDPVVLSYLLAATGPVTLADGEVITADNVVELTMSTAYARFPQDERSSSSNERKQYLQDIASAVVKKMTGPLPAPRKLLDALGRAASEGRIAVWSADPADQKLLEMTPLAHVVPDDEAPYVQVVVNNLAGNKMDYYLTRDIEYAADGCSGDMRNSTVTVRLANTASPSDSLPEYVGGSRTGDLPVNAPPGTMISSVRVIATKGARLLGVTANGKRTTAIPHTENGHPSFEVQVVIPPGQSGELTFRLSEPTAAGEPRVPVQPLIDNPTPNVSVPACP